MKRPIVNIESANRKLGLIFFNVIFSFIFLLLFKPFGLFYSNNQLPRELIFELALAMLLAFFAFLFTQFILQRLLRISIKSIAKVFLWFLFEMLIIGLLWGFADFIDNNREVPFINFFIEDLIGAVLVFFIPYFITITLILIRDLYISVNTDETIDENIQIENNIERTIAFKDENDSIKLNVRTEAVLMIQSSDNYVEISYVENNNIKKYLLRNSIKKVELQLKDSSIIRCHRSFMVNTSKVSSAIKTSAGLVLRIEFLPDAEIPVSKTYVSQVKSLL